MKNILLTLMVAGSVFANAQTAIPEFKNKVMMLTKNNTLESLEPTTLGTDLKPRMMGGANAYLTTDGDESSVKYNQAGGNRFIVKLDAGVDPESVISCYIFEVKKNSRRIKAGTVYIGAAKSAEVPVLKLEFKKVEDGVYIISPIGTIEEGEYMFFVNQQMNKSVTSDMKGYAFSVPGKS